jgi:hypothetical protein
MKNPVLFEDNISYVDLRHMVDPNIHYPHAHLNLERKIRGMGREMADAVLTKLYEELALETAKLRAAEFPDPIRGYLTDGSVWCELWRRVPPKEFLRCTGAILKNRPFMWYSQLKNGVRYWTRKQLRVGKKTLRSASPLKQLRVVLCPAQVLYYQARLNSCVTPEAKAAEVAAISTEIEAFLPFAARRILLQTSTVPGQPIFGCEVIGCNVHFDTGIWHIDLLISKCRQYTKAQVEAQRIPVDRLSRNEPKAWRGLAPYRAGKKELGKKGKWLCGANLQVLCGHKLTGLEKVWFDSGKAIQEERYAKNEMLEQGLDGLALDVGLNADMFKFAKARAVARGDLRRWEKAEQDYLAWLVQVQPLKDKIYAREMAIDGDPVRDRLDDAGKARKSKIDGAKATLQGALCPEIFSSDEMEEVARTFSWRKIATVVVDKWITVGELMNAAREGVGRFVQFLRDLFAKGGRRINEVDEPGDPDFKAAVDAAVASRIQSYEQKLREGRDLDEELARLARAGDEELLSLLAEAGAVAENPHRLDYDPEFDIRACLKIVDAMQAANVSPNTTVRLLLDKHAEGLQCARARRLAEKGTFSATIEPQEFDKMQDNDIPASPTVDFDESPFEIPENLQAFRVRLKLAEFRTWVSPAWRDASLPTREASIEERVKHVFALAQRGTVTDAQAREFLEKAPFGPFKSICTLVAVGGNSVDEAIDFVTSEKTPR